MNDIERVKHELGRLFVERTVASEMTLEEEVDLVLGSKGIYYGNCEAESTPGSQQNRLLQLSKERGLHCVVKQLSGFESRSVYICRDDTLWRAEAHHALQDRVLFEGGWNAQCEALQSHLLGYTEGEIELWIKERRWAEVLFTGGKTVFFLIARGQRDKIVAAGSRRLPVEDLSCGIVMRVSDGWTVPRGNSAKLLPEEKCVARVAIESDVIRRALTQDTRPYIFVAQESLEQVNAAMTSNIEVLVGEEWTDSRPRRVPLRYRKREG